ncbi:hypothetical protein AgCh_021887 [Apium graveolens]
MHASANITPQQRDIDGCTETNYEALGDVMGPVAIAIAVFVSGIVTVNVSFLVVLLGLTSHLFGFPFYSQNLGIGKCGRFVVKESESEGLTDSENEALSASLIGDENTQSDETSRSDSSEKGESLDEDDCPLQEVVSQGNRPRDVFRGTA